MLTNYDILQYLSSSFDSYSNQTWPITIQFIAYIPSFLLTIAGLLGNIPILLTIVKYRNSQTRDLIYWYVGSLAVYDILLLTLYWPFQLVKYSLSWPLGTFLCYVSNIFPILFGCGAAFTIVAIAIDRYRVILSSSNANPSYRRKIFNLAIILILSIAFTFPDIFFTSEKQSFTVLLGLNQPELHQICLVDIQIQNVSTSLTWLIYIVYRYDITCFIPLLSVLLINNLAKYKLNQQLIATKDETLYAQIKKNYKPLQMSLMLMIVLFLSWTPEHIYYYIMIVSPSLFDVAGHNINFLVFLICQFLLLSKCLINPVIYAYFIPECRRLLSSCIGFRRKMPSIDELSDAIVQQTTNINLPNQGDEINHGNVSRNNIVLLSIESNV